MSYARIMDLAHEAIKVQNKGQMEAALREIWQLAHDGCAQQWAAKDATAQPAKKGAKQ